MIVGAEAEEELPAEATEAIEALIRQITEVGLSVPSTGTP